MRLGHAWCGMIYEFVVSCTIRTKTFFAARVSISFSVVWSGAQLVRVDRYLLTSGVSESGESNLDNGDRSMHSERRHQADISLVRRAMFGMLRRKRQSERSL